MWRLHILIGFKGDEVSLVKGDRLRTRLIGEFDGLVKHISGLTIIVLASKLIESSLIFSPLFKSAKDIKFIPT